MNKSPRALALEAQPFNPALLTIAGDATTPNGLRYVNTFLNDYRNPDMISWTAQSTTAQPLTAQLC